MADYQRLAGGGAGIRELLAHPESADIAFEPPRLGGEAVRPAELP